MRVLLIERGGEILFEKRPDVGIWGGLWSLPECALDDDVAAALLRSASARASTSATRCRRSRTASRTFRLTLHPQRISARHWPTRAEAPGTLWLAPDDAQHAALPAPIRKLVRSLTEA